ncbi:reverse transcriptase domain-containing protein [Nephila pilipes]|uniref:Reverse transcriptase domain-containing protein n=1 Tax=Nephila pilipes TaxID=299642 RepID=A0A8X6PKK0_NEPPI|nr:reverse transcriptase domain-containing protein [Nephila pilipes]
MTFYHRDSDSIPEAMILYQREATPYRTDSDFIKRWMSIARIITGLRNRCPNDIVLSEADLRQFSGRRNSNLVKYYTKILSYNSGNRNSAFLKCWSNNQRPKKNSSYSQVISENPIFSSVEPHHLYSSTEPSVGIPEVFSHPTLLMFTRSKIFLSI